MGGRDPASVRGALRQAGAIGPTGGGVPARVAVPLVHRTRRAAGVSAGSVPVVAVLRGRVPAAGRRLHRERPLGPRHRRAGGANQEQADRVRGCVTDRRDRVFGRPAARRPRDPAQAQRLQRGARRVVPGAGRRVPRHEARHELAPGVPGPHVQLGRAARVRRGARAAGPDGVRAVVRQRGVLDAAVRHRVRAPGRGG